MIKTIKADGVEFMVQSYLKNEFAHIVSVIEKHSICISLDSLKVTGGYAEQGNEWIAYCDKLNIKNIKTELEKRI